MKCNEIRNLALAYLDSELDAKTSQEIQLHLQTCAECALIFEKEEKFNNRLFGVLRAGRHTPVMWDRIESLLQPGGRSRRPEEADGGVSFTQGISKVEDDCFGWSGGIARRRIGCGEHGQISYRCAST